MISSKNITTLFLMLQLGLLAGLAQPAVLWPKPTLGYQGTLIFNSVPIEGPHHFLFQLFDSAEGGNQIGITISNAAVPVVSGQFDVQLRGWSDFTEIAGTNVFLQTSVRPSSSSGPYTTLTRKLINSVPKALVANVAETAVAISPGALNPLRLGTNIVDGAIFADGSIDGGKIAPEQVLKSFNGLTDNVTLLAGDDLELTTVGNTMTMKFAADPTCTKYGDCYWTLWGNPILGSVNTPTDPPGPQTDISGLTLNNNWLGTTDDKALELRVGMRPGLRLEPATANVGNTVNVIGGYWENVVTPGVVAATIGGGGSFTGFNQVDGDYGTVGGGSRNTAGTFSGGAYATVGGGFGNLASGYISTIGGGARNSATDKLTTVSGGASNVAEAVYATVGGGLRNTNSADAGSIGGGATNRIQVNATAATISGGQSNLIQNGAAFGTIGGGRFNNVNAIDATIGGGKANQIFSTADKAVLGGGEINEVKGQYASLVGGQWNRVNNDYSFIGGGYGNVIDDTTSTIGGGAENHVYGHKDFIGGGGNNEAHSRGSTVGGGEHNLAMTHRSTIPGGLQARTDSYGQQAYASGAFANAGDAQGSLFVLRTNTTTGNMAELFLDGGTANERMIVPNNATWTFHILLVARSDTPSFHPDASAGWEIKGVIQNVNNFVTICSKVEVICGLGHPAALVPWPDPSVLNLNSPVQALAINVTGAAGDNIRWAATVRTVEVTNP